MLQLCFIRSPSNTQITVVLCALSDGVYCAIRSSGWLYLPMVGAWKLSLVYVHVGGKHSFHLRKQCVTIPPASLQQIDFKGGTSLFESVSKNMSGVAPLTNTFIVYRWHWVSYALENRPYQGDLEHVQLNLLLWLTLYASTKEAKKYMAALNYHRLSSPFCLESESRPHCHVLYNHHLNIWSRFSPDAWKLCTVLKKI